ncbi:MAG: ribonuclease III family protein [Kiritimatiellia bacterium]
MVEIFGYTFKNAALLEEALTTPAFRMTCPKARDNQRLEFLGDAVLDFLAADQLFAACPDDSEGSLTVKRTHMVSTPALCSAAIRRGLGARLRRNKGAAPLADDAKTYADAIEAIIGAAWLDGGLSAARTIFSALDLDGSAETSPWSHNPKGELQERAQAMTPSRAPHYRLLKTTGTSDKPMFFVEVAVEGLGAAQGRGSSKQAAEARAAARLLESLPQ